MKLIDVEQTWLRRAKLIKWHLFDHYMVWTDIESRSESPIGFLLYLFGGIALLLWGLQTLPIIFWKVTISTAALAGFGWGLSFPISRIIDGWNKEIE